MKTILTAAALAAATLILSACAGSSLGDLDFGLFEEIGIDPAKAQDKAKGVEAAVLGNAAKSLPVYCKAPGIARDVLRERFNARPEANGARLAVWCPGDPVLVLGQPE